MKVQGARVGGGSDGNGTIQHKVTPKKSRGKKKADHAEYNRSSVGEDYLSLKKQQRVTKAKRDAAAEASLADDG
jgi:hypothetical protein